MFTNNGDNNEKGSTIVEFLFMFPIFILVCLFVLETSFSWSDKHVATLAAYEAARSLSLENLDSDPCDGDQLQQARYTAIKRLASVAPTTGLVSTMLGKGSITDSFTEALGTSTLSAPLKRLLQGFGTAALSTDVTCVFDTNTNQINLTLTYYRIPKLPLVGKAMFQAYALAEMFKSTPQTPETTDDEKVDAMKSVITQINEKMLTLDMDPSQVLNVLSQVNGMSEMVNIKSLISDNVSTLQSDQVDILNNALASMDLSQELLNQELLLKTFVNGLPDALTRIPMTVEISFLRKRFDNNASVDGDALVSTRWNGDIKGLIKIDGDFRSWGNEMSVDHGFDYTESRDL
ncbi:MAG: pilus assembly protein [Bacteriovoracaceae bacterium]|nr:pilus assembly protein [Bacteriovoracaceae bacterium]